jgi:uncharacterized protein
MNPEERSLIEALFTRLAPLSAQTKDAEAEALIRARVASQPDAPYFLAQSTLVLQHVVEAAQSRIAELEKQLADSRAAAPQGSFLSGLFGTPSSPTPRPVPVQPPPLPSQPAVGGGFLQNAMATAAGVAGGALLFQGIEGLFGHGGSGIGSFGGGLGASAAPTEVINNYYEETPSDQDAAVNQDLYADSGDLSGADPFGGVDGFDGGDDSSMG